MLIKGDGDETEKEGFKVYPKPMFDFNTQREICIQGMKAAYATGLYGNDQSVLDGTWKNAFDDNAEGRTEGKQGGPAGLMTFEDADGTEEADGKSRTPKKTSDKANSSASPKSTRGRKREHSHGTLDFGKKKAK